MADDWFSKSLKGVESFLDTLDEFDDSTKGLWKVTEIIEEDGSRFWSVSNTGERKIHVFKESLAYKVSKLLNEEE